MGYDDEYREWVKHLERSNRALQRIIREYDRRVTKKRDRPLCGAMTRAGIPCQARAVWDTDKDKPRNGRCRMHGGLSTGPRTPEGKRRSLDALARAVQARRG